VCVSRQLKYFGYKLVTLTTLDGLPVVYDLVPANMDERAAAATVLAALAGCDRFADKGFVGADWQAAVRAQSGNRLWTVTTDTREPASTKS